MAATLITVRKPHDGANISRMQTLASLLPEGWIVNGGGETSDRDPNDIADFVRLGGKWVDYCGYPMYWREDALANWILGGNGFRRFLIRMNNLGFEHTFFSDDYGFQFPRSLVYLDSPLQHVEPSWVAPHTENIFSMFCIRHPQSQGAYFYAYGIGLEGIDVYPYYNFMAMKMGLNPAIDPEVGKFPWLLYGAAALAGFAVIKMTKGDK